LNRSHNLHLQTILRFWYLLLLLYKSMCQVLVHLLRLNILYRLIYSWFIKFCSQLFVFPQCPKEFLRSLFPFLLNWIQNKLTVHCFSFIGFFFQRRKAKTNRPWPLCLLSKSYKSYTNTFLIIISSWNNIMSCFIILKITPLPLPSPKERVIELRG